MTTYSQIVLSLIKYELFYIWKFTILMIKKRLSGKVIWK